MTRKHVKDVVVYFKISPSQANYNLKIPTLQNRQAFSLVSFIIHENSKSQARLRLAGSVKSVKPYLKMLTV